MTIRDSSNAVSVEGLNTFRRELKALDDALPKELRRRLKTIADLIASKATAAFEAGPGVAPKAAPSIKALAEQAGASVRLGGDRYPFALGAEFGGQRRPTTQQFQPWLGSGASAGYFLYPAVRAEREHILEELGRMLDDVARAAFPE